ncbi:hypothetical protein SAMN04487988_101486 [Algoriphagus hitonicola]|uniref:Uncharacterized protein n=1 Tax=Algoriphagus hitonicola TaxID=435880 RepID=A0A1I2P867_9BACT|nr:hypothetical protein [Algoriphagus hitonicola]SFG12274.1 hypothetical protein SAMN04487988_101486 [Algoriphagus hitonicola]
MEYVIDLLKILLPAGVVLYGMYLVIVSFISKDREKMLVDLKTQNTQVVLPVRLQAAERLSLLLERITPNNLVRRSNASGMTAAELHAVLLSEVREEFSHNFSQQVYFSEETWEAIKRAVEEVTTIINLSRQSLDKEATGMDLAKAIFTQSLERKNDAVAFALRQVKSEISIYF